MNDREAALCAYGLTWKLLCLAEDGRIIAVLQHTALEPLAENNGALRGDRRHFMWFPPNATRDALVPTTYRIPELDREGADKACPPLNHPAILPW